ncbi:hypothetical protein ACOSQ4_000902 [Xanthoceras sorbifolium]
MMPLYRNMDSYPNQRNQMPFPLYYYPSYDGIPPHMVVDQAKSPTMYESWPHGSHYAYPNTCQTCGNHGNFPGYCSFRPPLPHFSPSPPHHCCGHHPSFTEQYPVPCPFPTHHWMEQPRYEYDKGVHRDLHCCGCPNHIHNQKDDKGVRIEEQEPDVEKQSDSLVPFQLKNCPYPMVWIPPEYVKKYNEYRKPFESKVADQEIFPHDTKSHGNLRSSEMEPRVWNGWSSLDMNGKQGEDAKRLQNQQYEDKQLPFPIFWMPSKKEQEEPEKKDERKMNGWFPLDASSLKSLMQGDDEKRQNQQNEDKKRQFPYPIIWIPPDNSKQGEAEKKDQREANAAKMSAEEELPYSSKFIPVKPPQIDDGMSKSKKNKESLGGQAKSSQMKENSANQRSIPVKQVEVHKEDNSDVSEKKVREVTAKKAENISTDNSSGTGMRRQSSSPPKMSKLPPVCLRVEPLPRNKNGNGSSRIPSPPCPKGRSSKDTFKPSASSSLKENSPLGTQAPDASLKKSEEVEPQKYNLVDGKTSEYKNDDLRNGSQTNISVKLAEDSQETVSRKLSTETTGKDSDECKTEEEKGVRCERDVMAEGTTEAKKATNSAESADGGRRARIKDLSDVEAAMLIQSAYRGFAVRKLEPLKKLKQMAKVREQLAEVRNRIQALESSDLQKNDKERMVIGEMIMSLLLKLDTIQGLHPSLREFRKALAKDLVTLQEKLDALMMKRPKEFFKDVSTSKPADDPNIDTRSDVSMQETQNEAGIVENSLETSHDNDVNMKEQNQGQLSQMVSPVSNSQDQEISKQPSLASDVVHGRCESEVRELAVTIGKDSPVAEVVSNVQLEGEASHKELGATQVITTENKEGNNVPPELEQSVELTSISVEKSSSEEPMNAQLQGSCCDQNGENEDIAARKSDGIDESRELSPKMIDEEPVVSELEKNEVVGEEKNDIHSNEMKSVMSSSLTAASTEVENVVPATDNDIGADKDTETNLLAELPLGVIEDDLALSASEKHEQIDTVKVEVPSSEEARFNEATNTTSPTDETSSLNEVATDTISPMDATSSSNEVEQHSLNVELDDNIKVMTEELPGNAALENEEMKSLISIAGDEDNDQVLNEERDRSMINVNATPLLEAAVTSIAILQSNGKKEDDQQQQEPYGKEEEDVQEKKPECNKIDELPYGSEDMKLDLLVATPTSPRSIEEYNMVERDKKLIDENAKLREMMEKLMGAGKEQLSVISNLTGRVKDLERKLSKKKKLRRSRHTKATPSATKLHQSAMSHRAFEVAM